MILDSQLILSNNQAVTAIGDTASTNEYDTLSAGLSVGIGEEVYLHVQTRVAATSGGATTLVVALQDSADKMIAGDLNSKARLTQIANDLLGGRYSFVKNTTLPTTVGPSQEGMKRLHTTNFAYICEDLSYRVWSHGQ